MNLAKKPPSLRLCLGVDYARGICMGVDYAQGYMHGGIFTHLAPR